MGKEMRGGGEEGGAGAGGGRGREEPVEGKEDAKEEEDEEGESAQLSLFSYGFILVASARVGLLGFFVSVHAFARRGLRRRGGGCYDEGGWGAGARGRKEPDPRTRAQVDGGK